MANKSNHPTISHHSSIKLMIIGIKQWWLQKRGISSHWVGLFLDHPRNPTISPSNPMKFTMTSPWLSHDFPIPMTSPRMFPWFLPRKIPSKQETVRETLGLLAGLYKGFLANVVRSVGGALVLVWGTQLSRGAAGPGWCMRMVMKADRIFCDGESSDILRDTFKMSSNTFHD